MSAAAFSDAPPSAEVFPDLDQVEAHFQALNQPGEVREVRILEHVPASGYGGPSTASGYFDNPTALMDALRGIGSQHASGIYITQNPVDPDLLARANNRLKRKPKQTTADADISRLRSLTFDFDPVRKSGISATDAELAAALAVRDDFIEFVTAELGWSAPVVVMMSGNGGQATWRIDLPPDRADLVAAVLNAAAALFSTDAVSVDTTLANPSRIVKLSGTVAGKGDPLPHRPHRQARSAFHPQAGIVSEAQLRAFIALVPAPDPVHEPRSSNGRTVIASNGRGDPYDVQALLNTAGIGFHKYEKSWGDVYRLDRCLSSEDHADGAAILQLPSGGVGYRCHHNHCRGVSWQEVKAQLGVPSQPTGASTANGASDYRASGSDAQNRPSQDHPWPTLDDAALSGLAGDVVRTIEPHTEGDPVALLVNFLVMFGSAVGRSPHARVGAARHHTNLHAVHVGETARARKGTAHSEALRVVALADPGWRERVQGGLSSGEGLIYAVRDPLLKPNRDGEMKLADPGVEDKRLLAVESEFSSVLRVAGRDGNTLSELIRLAWDGTDLRTLTRSAPIAATNPHISVLGHITKTELLRELSDTYQANGFANRFQFYCVRRSKELPHGGALPEADVASLAARVREALAFARRTSTVCRDAEADQMWVPVYSALTAARPGMLGAITARAEAQVLRLSLLYALLDRSREMRRPHLEAALALWQYAEGSARFIFGDATGDPIADRVLSALRANGATSQSGLSDLFGRHLSATKLAGALETLLTLGKVRMRRLDTGGRPTTLWEAVS